MALKKEDAAKYLTHVLLKSIKIQPQYNELYSKQSCLTIQLFLINKLKLITKRFMLFLLNLKIKQIIIG